MGSDETDLSVPGALTDAVEHLSVAANWLETGAAALEAAHAAGYDLEWLLVQVGAAQRAVAQTVMMASERMLSYYEGAGSTA